MRGNRDTAGFDTLLDLVAMHGRTAAAILAGGMARRLAGVNKASLTVGGHRIIDRQLAALRQVAEPVFIVAGDPARFEGLGLDVVPDIMPNAGALGGIYTAIVRSPRDRTLIVACDMPFLGIPLLRHLTSVVDADLVIPRTRGGYEPLCAVYGKACAEPIRRRIEAGELKAAVLPDGVIVEEVGPEILAAYDPEGVLFVNVNTPHDWEQAQSLTELEPEPRQDRITD